MAEIQEARHAWQRWLLLICGWICVVLGVVGAFLPVMPTTPFLLLAAACFVRSSKRFYIWLVTHRWLGPLIRDYLDGGGIPLKAKVYAIGSMWIGGGISCWLVPNTYARLFVLINISLISLYILKQKTRPPRTQSAAE